MVKRPAPISLRIRANEVTARARQLLRELDEKDRLRRRARWMATKALISVREMVSVMSSADRARWQAECKQTIAFLEKIQDRGV
jgi:hypothetical protein